MSEAGDDVVRSRANARFKKLLSLGSTRGVRKHGLTMVCGRRLAAEALGHPDPIDVVVLDESEDNETTRRVVAGSLPRLVLAHELFREVDSLGTGPPLVVVRVEEPGPWQPSPDRPETTLLLPLGDPENLGAALRSAAAFGVDRVVLLAEAAHPYHPRAVRASAGACFWLALSRGPALADVLAEPPAEIDIFALDRPGEPISDVATELDGRPFTLVVGEEGRGLPPGGPARRIEIPQSSRVESLNAAAAVAIALWELRGRMGDSGTMADPHNDGERDRP